MTKTSRARTAPPRALTRAGAALLIALGAVSAGASPPRTAATESANRERTLLPAGNHQAAALESYLLGRDAWAAGRTADAIASWQVAADLDLEFLPSRLDLARAYVTSDPPRATAVMREVVDIFARDYRAQRWLAANGLLLVAMTAIFTFLLLSGGLLLHHHRALHHALAEAIAFLVRFKRPAGILAWVLLFVPVLANLGVIVTGLFWVFLASFRYGRGERMLALAAAAVVLLLGPYLWLTRPFWGLDPEGRDALAVAEHQQAPNLPSALAETEAWRTAQPTLGAPNYLAGLADLGADDSEAAISAFHRAAEAGDVPPRVLETNLGNALLALGKRQEAQRHYERAIALAPLAFEPHYNLGLADAANGQYIKADRELDRASRVNLDRLRALARSQAGTAPLRSLAAVWSAPELWAWSLRHPGTAPAPPAISALFPLRSSSWLVPLGLAVIGAGLWAGRWLRRLIRVHVCYQCGRSVCRRCLVRLERRAYCGSCADALGGKSAEETTRLLLTQLLNQRPAWTTRIGPALALVLPGIGPLGAGLPGLAAWTSLTTAVGMALCTYGAWGQPLLASPWPDPARPLLTMVGIGFILFSILSNLLGQHWAERRTKNLRAFLARDVDRLAA